ncbi:hypothetical protein HRI_004705600 [Hibiscus trionum]|uniref:Uncharacterized protein n=1 Tax=Hibiscus trionum TaxID=183268 RepID=A0A9W7JET2_HIBTR|nr:hypothetical protein HRI_004705600 [Hibiscus trionum]
MSCFNAFLFRKMFNLCGFFWVFISALFEFLSKVFSRTQRYNEVSQSNNQIEEKTKEEEEEEEEEEKEEEGEVFDEKTESPTFVFKFQFQTQTFEEFNNEFRGDEKNHCAVGLESDPSIITPTPDKYEFNPGNDFSCIMENPKDSSFRVKELYADSSNGFEKMGLV